MQICRFVSVILFVLIFILIPLVGDEAESAEKLGLTVCLLEYNPIGEFRYFSIVGVGLGATVDYAFFTGDPVLTPLKVKAGIDWVFNMSPQDKFSWLQDLHWGAGGVYIVPLNNMISLGGGVYYGGILHILNINSLASGEIIQSFYDQSVSIQAEIYIIPGDLAFEIAVIPGYQLFFEDTYPGHQIFIKAGARLAF